MTEHWAWPQWFMAAIFLLNFILNPLRIGRPLTTTAGEAVMQTLWRITIIYALFVGGFWK